MYVLSVDRGGHPLLRFMYFQYMHVLGRSESSASIFVFDFAIHFLHSFRGVCRQVIYHFEA